MKRRSFLKFTGVTVTSLKFAEILLDPDKSFTEFSDFFQDFSADGHDPGLPESAPGIGSVDDIVYILTEEPVEDIIVDRKGFYEPRHATVHNYRNEDRATTTIDEDEYLNTEAIDEGICRIEVYTESGKKYEEVLDIEIEYPIA